MLLVYSHWIKKSDSVLLVYLNFGWIRWPWKYISSPFKEMRSDHQAPPLEFWISDISMRWFRQSSEYQAVGMHDTVKEKENVSMTAQGEDVTARSRLCTAGWMSWQASPLTPMNKNKLHEESRSVSRWKISEIAQQSSGCSSKYPSLKDFSSL